MGYYTNLSGKMLIEPPLTWEKIKDSKYITSDAWPLGIKVKSESIETETGTFDKKSGVEVTIPEDSLKEAYTIDEDLQELVCAFPGHRFVGVIEGSGEEDADMWRLYVRHGKVIRTAVQVSWPEAPPYEDTEEGK